MGRGLPHPHRVELSLHHLCHLALGSKGDPHETMMPTGGWLPPPYGVQLSHLYSATWLALGGGGDLKRQLIPIKRRLLTTGFSCLPCLQDSQRQLILMGREPSVHEISFFCRLCLLPGCNWTGNSVPTDPTGGAPS